MPKKKVRPARRIKSLKRTTNPLVFIRQKIVYITGFTVLALLVSSRVVVTRDFRTGESVLGIQDQKSGTSEVSKTKSPNTVRTAVPAGTNIEFKYQVENGKAALKAEDNGGNTVKNRETERQELENKLEDEGVEISTEDGDLTVGKGNTKAVSRFPLSINPITHELIVTTPAGTKAVTILPDAAIRNFLAHGKVATTSATFGSIATDGGYLRDASGSGAVVKSVELTLRDNELVYKVKAERGQKLFGVFPIAASETAYISAQTGDMVAQTQTLLARFLNFFSF